MSISPLFVMSLARAIVYTVDKLASESVKPFKTLLHKVCYLALTEEREALYRPYFYGPYSDDVQSAIQSLLSKGYLQPSPKEYKLQMEKLKEKKLDVGSIADPEIMKRIDAVVHFLKQHQLGTVEWASNFSKIHYLTVRIGLNDSDLSSSVKHRAEYLGWSSVSEMESNEVLRLHQLAEELEQQLKVVH